MRVLIAATRYPPDFAGGAERRFHAMALAAHRQGHTVEVLATNAFTSLPSGPVDNVPVRRLDWPRPIDSAGREAAAFVADVLRREAPPDLVWTGNAAMGLGIRRAWPEVPVLFAPGEVLTLGWRARLARAWKRWRTEGRAVSRRWWGREAVVDALAHQAWTMALPSRLSLEYVTAGRPGAWPALRVLPRGVEVARWAPARALRRPDPDGALRVLMACRLEPLKNVEHVLEALARCRPHPVRLLVCGSGPHEKALRDRADQLGVADRVEFLGRRDDMVPVYAAADVLVMASNYDLYPNTVSEALASGCPVIIRCPDPPRVMIGIYEAVAGSPACRTYGTDDVEELASHLAFLAQHPGEREAMSRAAVDWAGRRDWDQVIGAYYLPSRNGDVSRVSNGEPAAHEAST
jgi:glycosyltransferase involved in cell wall biosynthesis